MNDPLIGKWVTVRQRHFKFLVNNIDWCYGEEEITENITNFDIEIQIALMALMRVPIRGYVKAKGAEDCYQVLICVGNLHDITYIDKKNLIYG